MFTSHIILGDIHHLLASPNFNLTPQSTVTDRMKPISVTSFRDHVQQMHAERDRGFEIEYQVQSCVVYCRQKLIGTNMYCRVEFHSTFFFQSLGSDPLASHEVSKLPFNRVKNRFANIFPCKYLVSCVMFKVNSLL